MELGLDKCEKNCTLDRNISSRAKLNTWGQNKEIQQLEQGKTYKYIRIEKSEGMQHHNVNESLKEHREKKNGLNLE
jgi:hypothetical protein